MRREATLGETAAKACRACTFQQFRAGSCIPRGRYSWPRWGAGEGAEATAGSCSTPLPFSPDHAVCQRALLAERIEVLKGPADPAAYGGRKPLEALSIAH